MPKVYEHRKGGWGSGIPASANVKITIELSR